VAQNDVWWKITPRPVVTRIRESENARCLLVFSQHFSFNDKAETTFSSLPYGHVTKFWPWNESTSVTWGFWKSCLKETDSAERRVPLSSLLPAASLECLQDWAPASTVGCEMIWQIENVHWEWWSLHFWWHGGATIMPLTACLFPLIMYKNVNSYLIEGALFLLYTAEPKPRAWCGKYL
jgi:hypothetical protein